jgi:hypothetical protein
MLDSELYAENGEDCCGRDKVIDYTSEYRNCWSGDSAIAAHGKGRNFYALMDLGDNPVKRFDGKKGRYMLIDMRLSQSCEHDRDQAYACVQGDDCTYWTGTEISAKMRRDLANGKKTLFDLFRDF